VILVRESLREINDEICNIIYYEAKIEDFTIRKKTFYARGYWLHKKI
jgi:hypothetical protein